MRWLMLLMGLVAAGSAEAATLTLTWDANTESDMAGYHVYSAGKPVASCADADLVEVKAVGLVTTTTINISVDGDYCFALKARDTANNRSGFSNKVGITVNVNPPQSPRNLQGTVGP